MLLRHGILKGRILVGRDLLIGHRGGRRQLVRLLLAIRWPRFLPLSRRSLIITGGGGRSAPVIIFLLMALPTAGVGSQG
jgi:hypothetical protein